LPVGYTLSNGKATGSKVFKDGKEIGTLIVFGEVDGDGKFSGLDPSKIVTELLGGISELPELHNKIAADINHDGYITYDDVWSSDSDIGFEEWVQNIDQNVPAKEIKKPETISTKELLEMLKIANNNKAEEVVINSDPGYKITLNKEYTYLELYNHINEKLGNTCPVKYDYGNNNLFFTEATGEQDRVLFEKDGKVWKATDLANSKVAAGDLIYVSGQSGGFKTIDGRMVEVVGYLVISVK